MGIMVYSLLWVMQDLYETPSKNHRRCPLKEPFRRVGGGPCAAVIGRCSRGRVCVPVTEMAEGLGFRV